MGVLGLWQLLQPSGRPVSLESLEGKILAVDVSIWLHQAMKGMRDKDGGPMSNAHLHVLFNRVCKLLFYKIKPIFVFDGAAPQLKKHTLASRRERKEFAELDSEKTSKKLVQNLIQSHAVKQVLGSDKRTLGKSDSVPRPSTSKQDLFELPPLPENFRGADSDEEQNSWEERNIHRQMIEEEFQDFQDVDIEAEDFKCLPVEIQHEILSEMKERRKRPSRMNFELPQNSDDFAKFQMSKLLKQNHLSSRIEEVRKEMNSRTSGELTVGLDDEFQDTEVQTRRIVSDDTSHFILIKGLSRRRRAEEIAKIESERKNLEIVDESDEKEDENVNDELLLDDDENEDTNKTESLSWKVDDEKNKLHSRSSHIKSHLNVKNSGDLEFRKLSEIKNQVLSVDSSDDEENSNEIVSTNTALQPAVTHVRTSQRDITHSENAEDEITVMEHSNETYSNTREEMASVKQNSEEINSRITPKKKKGVESQKQKEKRDVIPEIITVESEQSEDEGFIEVCINPDRAQDDELFPADMFSTNPSKSETVLKDKPESPQVAENSDVIEINEEDKEENLSTTDRLLAEQYKSLMENGLEEFREELQTEMEVLQQERGKQERLGTSITDQMHSEAQDLLQLFGVPFIVSPAEAEAQCAQLDQANLCHGTITNDSDIWLFGGKRVYKNFFNQDRHVEFYTDSTVQTNLGLTRKILINIALLCGSDYTAGIAGVGPVTAMEILSEFPGQDITALEKFRAWWDEQQGKMKQIHERKLTSKLRQLEINPGFPSKAVVEAYLNPTIDNSDETFTWAIPDLDQLRQFAAEKLGWTRVKADEVLLPVMKQVNDKQIQPKINSFFQPEHFIESQKIKSDRLNKALKKLHTSKEKPSKKSAEEKRQHAKSVLTKNKTKNTRKRQKEIKGKTPVKSKRSKVPSKKSTELKAEVNLSESSSSNDDDDDDEILANLNYDEWMKDDNTKN